MSARRRICLVVASPMTARAFLAGHMEALAGLADVDLVADFSGGDGGAGLACRRHSIGIRRKVSPLHDLAALVGLVRLFRRERFAVVHSVTPKAGLLALLAGWFAGVPRRVHIFTGQVWATRRGAARWALKAADRLMARLATDLLADSPSQRDFLVAEGVAPRGKLKVLGAGAICGVDAARFRPDPETRRRVRDELGIPRDAVVFHFVGRLNRDKGVLDLATAFAALPAPAWLLVVGPDEGMLRLQIERRLGPAAGRARFVGYTDRPEAYMAASDVLCLPSYREGFGMVVVEAAACGLPAVASRIYGVTDAVEEGATGVLHPPGDAAELGRRMAELLADGGKRLEMGSAARRRALDLFSRDAVTRAWLGYYGELLR